MGSSNSGRYRTRNIGAMEQATTLDVRQLRRQGMVAPHIRADGVLTWRDGSGREIASIQIFVEMGAEKGVASLSYSHKDEARKQHIRLESRPMPYGGRRFYFVCPSRGHLCERLPVINGVFASRQAHQLAYASQSEDKLGRMHRRADKLDRRLNGPAPQNRPRGARRERLLGAWVAAEEQRERFAVQEIQRRWGHLDELWR